MMRLAGRWRIVDMELWDADAIDLVGPGSSSSTGTGWDGWLSSRARVNWTVVRWSATGVPVPWARRRQAARLLEAVINPQRGFDAIIVGESERAFTGTQLLHLAQVFLTRGVQGGYLRSTGRSTWPTPPTRRAASRPGWRTRC